MVDAELRVHGVEGLQGGGRVGAAVDRRGNLNAPVQMIAAEGDDIIPASRAVAERPEYPATTSDDVAVAAWGALHRKYASRQEFGSDAGSRASSEQVLGRANRACTAGTP